LRRFFLSKHGNPGDDNEMRSSEGATQDGSLAGVAGLDSGIIDVFAIHVAWACRQLTKPMRVGARVLAEGAAGTPMPNAL